jgi:hypothetical protein
MALPKGFRITREDRVVYRIEWFDSFFDRPSIAGSISVTSISNSR